MVTIGLMVSSNAVDGYRKCMQIKLLLIVDSFELFA
jgi:hypothetical protein